MKQVAVFNQFSLLTLKELRAMQITTPDAGVYLTVISRNDDTELFHISDESYEQLVEDYGNQYFLTH